MNSSSTANMPARVMVIVPVYRNLNATEKCIESLIASDLPDNTDVTIINDQSPEQDLSDYCTTAAARAGFNIVINQENLGFVKTANLGFALAPEADIVLLNSDTVVSNDWLQRLQGCAYQDESIGTVTPFSNNGTICSYPVFPISNELPNGWSAQQLDSAFQLANSGSYAELPTGVGFCLYLKRGCLNDTGLFDEENFGLGYGEECDFSVRASARDWKHVIAADVFVYHEGGASFALESDERKIKADKIMHRLHPHYDDLVSNFLHSDPLYTLRSQVDTERLKQRPSDSSAIFEEHRRYSITLLKRLNEMQSTLSMEKDQRRQLDAALADAENLLQNLNRELVDTSSGLKDAQDVVDNLNLELKRIDADLHDNKVLAEQLTQKIELMEQSRSWRYTAWMRKGK
ncbi:MAG: GT2 family glycosyltransferase [Halioglobus sp.]|jgi:GT2 family glycosyltransferase